MHVHPQPRDCNISKDLVSCLMASLEIALLLYNDANNPFQATSAQTEQIKDFFG